MILLIWEMKNYLQEKQEILTSEQLVINKQIKNPST